jgi:hypothetical protein
MSLNAHCHGDLHRPLKSLAGAKRMIFTVVFYGLKIFGCKTVQFNATPCETTCLWSALKNTLRNVLKNCAKTAL